jgi:hypothetical protein
MSLSTAFSFQLVSIRESTVTPRYDRCLTVLSRTLLQVPFLNLMAILKQRGGEVHIRVGGNTQETATIVDSIPGGRVLTKAKGNSSNPVSPYQKSCSRTMLDKVIISRLKHPLC